MSSYYSVIQFLPNPLSGERVNVGVVAFNDAEVLWQPIHDWTRVEQFAGYATTIQDAVQELIETECTSEDIRRMAATWTDCLQLTSPRASLADPKELLAEMTNLMLADH